MWMNAQKNQAIHPYGHLSSFDIISLEGFGPPGGGILPPDRAWAAVGPMARSATDLAFALAVLAGVEGRDAIGYRLARA
jgi:amidase